MEFSDRMYQITLEAFWTEKVPGEERFERTDSMLEGLGAGRSASFLSKFYPGLSRYQTREFLKALTELSIVVVLKLLVTFGSENFTEGPAVLLTEGIQNLLD